MIKSRKLKWTENIARISEDMSAFNMLTGKPSGNKLIGKSRHRWEDSIRKNLKEIVVDTIKCIDLTKGRD